MSREAAPCALELTVTRYLAKQVWGLKPGVGMGRMGVAGELADNS